MGPVCPLPLLQRIRDPRWEGSWGFQCTHCCVLGSAWQMPGACYWLGASLAGLLRCGGTWYQLLQDDSRRNRA